MAKRTVSVSVCWRWNRKVEVEIVAERTVCGGGGAE